MFWQCSNNIAYEFNCRPGLASNDYLKICDSQSLINCREDKIKNKNSTEKMIDFEIGLNCTEVCGSMV
jgi:hypothetical protein